MANATTPTIKRGSGPQYIRRRKGEGQATGRGVR
jgi:hypothetical protein